MTSHIRYLRYVLTHKWHVLYGGLSLGVPVWRLLAHDWTKFTPAEWGPYVRRFSVGNNSKWEKDTDPQEWKEAWAHHWTHNPHHWEYFAYGHAVDIDSQQHVTAMIYPNPVPMPETYVREMVADWYGAGMAQGKPDIEAWYEIHKNKMVLHESTRYQVTQLIQEAKRKRLIP